MIRPRLRAAPGTVEGLGRWSLVGLLLVLLLSAATLDRKQHWPHLIGDEATYLMAAESLAWDLDLRYERRDYDRFVGHWERPPEGLILQSGDRGATLTFGKPFFYPLYLAAFVRLAPVRAAPVANVVLLAAAALFVSRRLRPVLGAAAPWWTAALVFASVAWTYVYWVHADLFLMSLTAFGLGLALPQGESPAAEPRGGGHRLWFLAAAGALLGVVVFSRPLYLPLLLPAAAAVPRQRWIKYGGALVGGVVGIWLLSVALHLGLAGAWTSYGAERGGFYSWTGFPAVDYPASDWSRILARDGNMAWGGWAIDEVRAASRGFDGLRLWRWNIFYLLLGRDVGLVPYFLPALLGFLAWPRDRARRLMPLAVILSLVGILALRPFNFFGGGAAIANRYFLPLYPATWLMAGRRRSACWALAAVIVAAPFLWPLWRQGSDYPRTPTRTWGYVSSTAQRWLPYETTQSHLKPSGQEDLAVGGLWIKILGPQVSSPGDGALAVRPETPAELLVGSYQPLAAVVLELESDLDASVRPLGRRLEVVRLEEQPGNRYRIALGSPIARHPMWWSTRDFWLYRLRLVVAAPGDEPVVFRLWAAEGG